MGLALYFPVWAQDKPPFDPKAPIESAGATAKKYGAAGTPAKPKLAELNTDSEQFGVISVDGFWEPDYPTKQNEVVPTAVHIECFRHGGKEANLVKTDAFCVVATATAVTILMADFSFMEASWSDDEVVISDDHPTCIIRKPEAKGFPPLLDCKLLPDRQSYYLRDRVDYAMFHEPAK
jgi:hypothetical protein